MIKTKVTHIEELYPKGTRFINQYGDECEVLGHEIKDDGRGSYFRVTVFPGEMDSINYNTSFTDISSLIEQGKIFIITDKVTDWKKRLQ